MTLDAAFFRTLTQVAFDSLAEYCLQVEQQSSLAYQSELNDLQARLKSLKLSEDEWWSEWQAGKQEFEAKYEMLDRNFHRYSLVVLLCLLTEDHLRRLVTVARTVRPTLPAAKEPRDGIFKYYQDYFEQAGITSNHWRQLKDLYVIRNRIVHSSGRVATPKHLEDVLGICRRSTGLHISNVYEGDQPAGIQPLYLEANMILIGMSYCQQAIAVARDHFEQLCEGVPLYPLFPELKRK